MLIASYRPRAADLVFLVDFYSGREARENENQPKFNKCSCRAQALKFRSQAFAPRHKQR
jgi:hypothetical protein